MKVNKNENVILVDVDDTLLTLNNIDKKNAIKLKHGKFSMLAMPLTKNIELLKQMKFRGFHIRVHSQGGHRWAKYVVKALKLEKYVDDVESKPKWYIDDLAWDKFCHRINKYEQETR